MRIWSLALVILGLLTAPLQAHEFWIMPEDFRIAPGEEVVVHLREGENFQGKSISYHSRRFHTFDLLSPNGVSPIIGRNDAIPAASIEFSEPGLNILLYQSKLSLLTYDDMARFERFLNKMKLGWALEEHRKRGLSETSVREAYFRYAKALVQVGDSDQGADKVVGMPFELVALSNPYQGADTLKVQLHYKQEPYANKPLFVFHRSAQGVEKHWYETDDKGVADISLAGGGDFQINAVHLQAASDKMNAIFGAVWQTLWTSMTFAISP